MTTNIVYTDKEQAEYDAGYDDGKAGNAYSQLPGRAGYSSPYGQGYYDSYVELTQTLDALAKYHNSPELEVAAEFLRHAAGKI